MENVIIRNILRLVGNSENSDSDNGQTRIEPMSEWKWRKLYDTVQNYEIGPWIAEGMQRMEGDFFLQPSSELRQQLLDMKGDKDPKHLKRFLLQIDRAQGLMHRLKKESLQTYVSDFISAVRNIEE